jgi:cytosine deaminase
MFGATAARIAGFEGKGHIAAGLPADLVLTRARTLQELVSRPQSDRVVLVAGRAIDTTLPDYRELDYLHDPDEKAAPWPPMTLTG